MRFDSTDDKNRRKEVKKWLFYSKHNMSKNLDKKTQYFVKLKRKEAVT